MNARLINTMFTALFGVIALTGIAVQAKIAPFGCVNACIQKTEFMSVFGDPNNPTMDMRVFSEPDCRYCAWSGGCTGGGFPLEQSSCVNQGYDVVFTVYYQGVVVCPQADPLSYQEATQPFAVQDTYLMRAYKCNSGF